MIIIRSGNIEIELKSKSLNVIKFQELNTQNAQEHTTDKLDRKSILRHLVSKIRKISSTRFAGEHEFLINKQLDGRSNVEHRKGN